MANLYGANYTKEWINDPSEAADKGTQNAKTCQFYDEFAGVVATDKLIICKIQELARYMGLEELSGALGAGIVEAIDKDGNATVLAAGDLIDGAIEGGYEITLTADGATAAAPKLLAKFLRD